MDKLVFDIVRDFDMTRLASMNNTSPASNSRKRVQRYFLDSFFEELCPANLLWRGARQETDQCKSLRRDFLPPGCAATPPCWNWNP